MTSRVLAALAGAWLGAAAGVAAPAGAAPLRYVVLPSESRVEFVSGTQLGEFRGGTGDLVGEVVYDPAAPAALRLAVAVEAASLRSDNAARDRHMREKLLEVGRFPRISLRGAAFAPASRGSEGTLQATLALHGVEREVTVPVRFALDGVALRGEGRFTLRLADFGMAPPRLLGLKVRDEVAIEVRLVAAAA